MSDLAGRKVLVTGGGGFIGGRVVAMLCEAGADVRFVARGRYPATEALGARGVQADLRDASALAAAFDGVEDVVHVAAKADAWGDRADFFATNVEGTNNVVAACQRTGVRRLVYTSTPSVIGYEHDVENGRQDLPYAATHLFWYGESKAIAEQQLLAANGVGGLATVSLRPHLVIGPGDNNLIPKLVDRARTGRLIRVGDGRNRVDLTDVDNAAGAHLDALRALTGPDAPCAGKAYFISNDEPVVLWDWIDALLAALQIPAPTRSVSLDNALRLGAVMEWVWRTFGLSGQPRLTRMIAAGLARAHWYDMGPARRDLGYTIRVDMTHATMRLVEALKANERSAG
jgi:nucleoside-diphosphate-sugar epimerase